MVAAWSRPGLGTQPAAVQPFLEKEATTKAPGEPEKTQERSLLTLPQFVWGYLSPFKKGLFGGVRPAT